MKRGAVFIIFLVGMIAITACTTQDGSGAGYGAPAQKSSIFSTFRGDTSNGDGTCGDQEDNNADGTIDLGGCDCDDDGVLDTGLGSESALRNDLCGAAPGTDVSGYDAWCSSGDGGTWYDADDYCEEESDTEVSVRQGVLGESEPLEQEIDLELSFNLQGCQIIDGEEHCAVHLEKSIVGEDSIDEVILELNNGVSQNYDLDAICAEGYAQENQLCSGYGRGDLYYSAEETAEDTYAFVYAFCCSDGYSTEEFFPTVSSEGEIGGAFGTNVYTCASGGDVDTGTANCKEWAKDDKQETQTECESEEFMSEFTGKESNGEYTYVDEVVADAKSCCTMVQGCDIVTEKGVDKCSCDGASDKTAAEKEVTDCLEDLAEDAMGSDNSFEVVKSCISEGASQYKSSFNGCMDAMVSAGLCSETG